MARTDDENRFVKNVEGLVKRLRDKAEELAATPPTMANSGQLPHVLERLASIDGSRANRMDLFARTVQVNTKLAETRLIALTAVQNLLVEAENTLAGLESTGIQHCANLLRWFEALTALIAPNLRVSDEFRSLVPQISHIRAVLVEKAIAMLHDAVARARTTGPTTVTVDYNVDQFMVDLAFLHKLQGTTATHQTTSQAVPAPSEVADFAFLTKHEPMDYTDDDFESVFDMLQAPTISEPTPTSVTMPDHQSVASSSARAAPIGGQNSTRESEGYIDDETFEREDELRRALAALSARRSTLLSSMPPSSRAYVRLVRHLRESPLDVITFLYLEEDQDALREWIEDLLSDEAIGRRPDAK